MQYITDIRWARVKNPLTCASGGQWDNGSVCLADRCLLHASGLTRCRREMIPRYDCPVSVVEIPGVNVIAGDSCCIALWHWNGDLQCTGPLVRGPPDEMATGGFGLFSTNCRRCFKVWLVDSGFDRCGQKQAGQSLVAEQRVKGNLCTSAPRARQRRHGLCCQHFTLTELSPLSHIYACVGFVRPQ